MKRFKKALSMLLALILCYSFCAVSLAQEEESIQPYSQFGFSPSLTTTKASLLGSSSANETITVSFSLYTSSGSFITSGRATGTQQVVASAKVNLVSGSYRMTATVSNGTTSATRYFTLTV